MYLGLRFLLKIGWGAPVNIWITLYLWMLLMRRAGFASFGATLSE